MRFVIHYIYFFKLVTFGRDVAYGILISLPKQVI